MSVIDWDAAGRPIYSFPIFYDVPQSTLSLDTFIRTASEFNNLVEAFNQDLFEGQLQYKVYVLPPIPGSFGQRLGIVVIAGASFVFGAITSSTIGDFGKGIIEGIVERPLQEWGREIGTDFRETIEELWDDEEPEAPFTVPIEEENRVACEAVIDLSTRFLSQTNDKLREAGVDSVSIPAAFDAKNGFFEACEINPQIRGIGFGETPDFPIRREDFQRRQSPIPKVDKDDWKFESVRYFVTSPNWDRMDKQRGWKGRDSRGAVAYFQIVDDLFWNRFDNGMVSSQNIDGSCLGVGGNLKAA